jgi:hypothetical protein
MLLCLILLHCKLRFREKIAKKDMLHLAKPAKFQLPAMSTRYSYSRYTRLGKKFNFSSATI